MSAAELEQAQVYLEILEHENPLLEFVSVEDSEIIYEGKAFSGGARMTYIGEFWGPLHRRYEHLTDLWRAGDEIILKWNERSETRFVIPEGWGIE